MSRPLRLDYPGAIHHVMNRGASRQSIFPELEDRALFLNVLSKTVRQWKIRVHAYSLMDNHYHLLVETPLGNLSRAMRYLKGTYTQYFNRQHRRDGALMRGRFKSILVHKDSYFLELIRYIHLNGVRAFLYPGPHFDPNGSHQHYLHPTHAPDWLTRDTALAFFASDPRGAIPALDAFVKEGISEEVIKILDGKKWPALLGTKEFVKRIRDSMIRLKPVEPEMPQEKPLRRLASPRKVLKTVMNVFNVSLRNILKRHDHRKNEARRAAIYFLRRASHLTYEEIGRWMGGLRRSHISRICTIDDNNLPRTCGSG